MGSREGASRGSVRWSWHRGEAAGDRTSGVIKPVRLSVDSSRRASSLRLTLALVDDMDGPADGVPKFVLGQVGIARLIILPAM